MPWKNITDDGGKPDKSNFYFCRVDKTLLDKVELHRKKLRQNKTVATEAMMMMYLKLSLREEIRGQ